MKRRKKLLALLLTLILAVGVLTVSASAADFTVSGPGWSGSVTATDWTCSEADDHATINDFLHAHKDKVDAAGTIVFTVATTQVVTENYVTDDNSISYQVTDGGTLVLNNGSVASGNKYATVTGNGGSLFVAADTTVNVSGTFANLSGDGGIIMTGDVTVKGTTINTSGVGVTYEDTDVTITGNASNGLKVEGGSVKLAGGLKKAWVTGGELDLNGQSIINDSADSAALTVEGGLVKGTGSGTIKGKTYGISQTNGKILLSGYTVTTDSNDDSAGAMSITGTAGRDYTTFGGNAYVKDSDKWYTYNLAADAVGDEVTDTDADILAALGTTPKFEFTYEGTDYYWDGEAIQEWTLEGEDRWVDKWDVTPTEPAPLPETPAPTDEEQEEYNEALADYELYTALVAAKDAAAPVEATAGDVFTNCTFTMGKDSDATSGAGYSVVAISGGTVDFVGGAITGNNDTDFKPVALKVTGGTVTVDGTNISGYNTAVDVSSTGNVTITGNAKITNNADSGYAAAVAGEDAKLTVKTKEIEGDDECPEITGTNGISIDGAAVEIKGVGGPDDGEGFMPVRIEATAYGIVGEGAKLSVDAARISAPTNKTLPYGIKVTSSTGIEMVEAGEPNPVKITNSVIYVNSDKNETVHGIHAENSDLTVEDTGISAQRADLTVDVDDAIRGIFFDGNGSGSGSGDPANKLTVKDCEIYVECYDGTGATYTGKLSDEDEAGGIDVYDAANAKITDTKIIVWTEGGLAQGIVLDNDTAVTIEGVKAVVQGEKFSNGVMVGGCTDVDIKGDDTLIESAVGGDYAKAYGITAIESTVTLSDEAQVKVTNGYGWSGSDNDENEYDAGTYYGIYAVDSTVTVKTDAGVQVTSDPDRGANLNLYGVYNEDGTFNLNGGGIMILGDKNHTYGAYNKADTGNATMNFTDGGIYLQSENAIGVVNDGDAEKALFVMGVDTPHFAEGEDDEMTGYPEIFADVPGVAGMVGVKNMGTATFKSGNIWTAGNNSVGISAENESVTSVTAKAVDGDSVFDVEADEFTGIAFHAQDNAKWEIRGDGAWFYGSKALDVWDSTGSVDENAPLSGGVFVGAMQIEDRNPNGLESLEALLPTNFYVRDMSGEDDEVFAPTIGYTEESFITAWDVEADDTNLKLNDDAHPFKVTDAEWELRYALENNEGQLTDNYVMPCDIILDANGQNAESGKFFGAMPLQGDVDVTMEAFARNEDGDVVDADGNTYADWSSDNEEYQEALEAYNTYTNVTLPAYQTAYYEWLTARATYYNANKTLEGFNEAEPSAPSVVENPGTLAGFVPAYEGAHELDLNGKTLSYASNGTNTDCVLSCVVHVKGTGDLLTVDRAETKGSILFDGTNGRAVEVEAGLFTNGVLADATTSPATEAVSGATLLGNKDATVKLSGGKYIQNSGFVGVSAENGTPTTDTAILLRSGASEVVINGDYVVGKVNGVVNMEGTGTVTVNNGTVKGGTDGIKQNSTGSTTVTGGTVTGGTNGINASAGTLLVQPDANTAVTITGKNGIVGTDGITEATIVNHQSGATLTIKGTEGDGVNVKAKTIYIDVKTDAATTTTTDISGNGNGIVADCSSETPDDGKVNITGCTVTGETGSGVYLKNGKMNAKNSTLQGATYGLRMEGENSTATVNNCQLLCTKTDYSGEGHPTADEQKEAGLCFMGKSLTVDNAIDDTCVKPDPNKPYYTNIKGGYNGIYFNSTGSVEFGPTVYVEGVHNGAMLDSSNSGCGITGGYIKGGVNGVVTKGVGNFQAKSGTIYGGQYGIHLEKGGDVDMKSGSTVVITGGTDGIRAETSSGTAEMYIQGGGTIKGGYNEDGTAKTDGGPYNGITIVRNSAGNALLEMTEGTITGVTNGIAVIGEGTDSYTVSIKNTGGNVAITGENGYGINISGGCTSFTLNSSNTTNTLKVEGKNGDGINVKANKITMTLTDKAEITGSANGIRAEDADWAAGDENAAKRDSTITVNGATIKGNGSMNVGMYAEKINSVTVSDAVADHTTIYGGNSGLNLVKSIATVNSGKIVGNGTSDWAYGIDVDADSDLTVSGGTITGKEGILTKGTTTISAVADNPETTEVNEATSPVITGTVDGVKVENGTTTISGGTVTGTTHGLNATDGTVTVKGGTINGADLIAGAAVTVTSAPEGGCGTIADNVTLESGSLTINGDSNSFTAGKTITVSGGTLAVTDLTDEGNETAHTTVNHTIIQTADSNSAVDLGVGTQYKSLSMAKAGLKLADMLNAAVTNVQDTANSNVYEVNGAKLQKPVEEGDTVVPSTLSASTGSYFLLTRNDAVVDADVTITATLPAEDGTKGTARTSTGTTESLTLDRVALRSTGNSGYSFTLKAGTAAQDTTGINRQIKWTATKSGETDPVSVVGTGNDEINIAALSYEGEAVTVKVGNQVPAGTYTITATSVQDTSKANTYTVTVAKTSLNGATVTLNPASGNYVYTGSEITAQVADVAVKVNNTAYSLTAGTDYTVTNNKRTNANTTENPNYTLTVTAVEDKDCSASKTASWKITEQNIANATITITPSSYTADNNAKTPTISVKYGDTPLAENTDYTVSGDTTGTNVGTYTVTITGKGNYAGTKTATWKINSAGGGGGGGGTGGGGGGGSIGGGGGGAVTTKTYTITCGTGVKADVASSASGKTITLTVSEGYENIVVKDADGKAVTVSGNTFKMPEADVTVSVSKKAVTATTYDKCDKGETCVLTTYTDVANNAWYHDGIHYCLDNGMMNGVGNGMFAPNDSTTRAMIWTILGRLDGETITGATWADVAQAWSVKAGISDGTNPNGNVTREQLAAMLYRFAALKGYDVTASGDLTTYGDAASVSDYAVEAMQWAVGAGIINGDNGNLKPTAGASRAEVATMLMRFCETIVK